MASFLESSALFKNAFQRGILSIFCSIGRNPLQIWKKQVSIESEGIRHLQMELVKSVVQRQRSAWSLSVKETF